MPVEFDELGLRFVYPDNWELERDGEAGWPRTISVHGPSGAFWSVTQHKGPADEDLMHHIVQTLFDEYEDVESQPITRQVGRWKLEGCELAFYCLDFLVTAQVVACQDSDRQLVILSQAENRDFDQLSAVFDAMTLSLLEAGEP